VSIPNFLIYLHGFNSSPASKKAMQMKNFVEKNCPHINFIAPQISVIPVLALQQIEGIVDAILLESPQANIGFVGSSMGGFLATLCSEKYQRCGVLINPAVAPHQLIPVLIGHHTNPYTNETHTITSQHGVDLEIMNFEYLNVPNNLWVLLQQGDETLDYRDAVSVYKESRLTIEPQGDHGFVGFERFLHSIIQFLFINKR